MVSGKGADQVLPQKGSALQIKQDDKFFCRLLSKETSMSHPSFRVAAVAVPFVWESEPGTPKYKIFSEDTLPPLTPPPSYYYNNISSCNNKNNSNNKPVNKKLGSRSNLLLALFPKLSLKKTNTLSPHSSTYNSSSSSSPPPPPPLSFSSNYCSSSWSSSSDSSKVVPTMGRIRRRRFLSIGSSFDFRGDDEVEGAASSPTSTHCLGISRSTSSKGNNGSSCRR